MSRQRRPTLTDETWRIMYQRLRELGMDFYKVVPQNPQLHHALLTKNDMRGLPDSEYKKIHDPRNLVWVSANGHASHADIPTRQEAWARLCELYGRDAEIEWFESIQWRESPPFTVEWLEAK